MSHRKCQDSWMPSLRSLAGLQLAFLSQRNHATQLSRVKVWDFDLTVHQCAAGSLLGEEGARRAQRCQGAAGVRDAPRTLCSPCTLGSFSSRAPECQGRSSAFCFICCPQQGSEEGLQGLRRGTELPQGHIRPGLLCLVLPGHVSYCPQPKHI